MKEPQITDYLGVPHVVVNEKATKVVLFRGKDQFTFTLPDSPEERTDKLHTVPGRCPYNNQEGCPYPKPETTHEKDIVNPQNDDCKPERGHLSEDRNKSDVNVDFIEEARKELVELWIATSGEPSFKLLLDFFKEKLTEALEEGGRKQWMVEQIFESGRLAMKEEVLNEGKGWLVLPGDLFVTFFNRRMNGFLTAIRDMK